MGLMDLGTEPTEQGRAKGSLAGNEGLHKDALLPNIR